MDTVAVAVVFAPKQIYGKLLLLPKNKYVTKWYFSKKVFATRQICGKYKFSFQQSFLKMQLRKFSSDLK